MMITTNCYVNYPPGHPDDNKDEGDVTGDGKRAPWSKQALNLHLKVVAQTRDDKHRADGSQVKWHGGLRGIHRIQAKNLTNCE